jgi:hypothetical protein
MRADTMTVTTSHSFAPFITTKHRILNLDSKELREWFINSSAVFSWGRWRRLKHKRKETRGNMVMAEEREAKGKRTVIKEHHVNETKETEWRNLQNYYLRGRDEGLIVRDSLFSTTVLLN